MSTKIAGVLELPQDIKLSAGQRIAAAGGHFAPAGERVDDLRENLRKIAAATGTTLRRASTLDDLLDAADQLAHDIEARMQRVGVALEIL